MDTLPADMSRMVPPSPEPPRAWMRPESEIVKSPGASRVTLPPKAKVFTPIIEFACTCTPIVTQEFGGGGHVLEVMLMLPPFESVSRPLAVTLPPLRKTGPPVFTVNVPPPAPKPETLMPLPAPPVRFKPPPAVMVTLPAGSGLTWPLASSKPLTSTLPASMVTVFGPTTSVPLSVTFRPAKSRSQIGALIVIVPFRLQLAAPQQLASLTMLAALQVGPVRVLLHTASAPRLPPSSAASAVSASRRVSGICYLRGSPRHDCPRRHARARRARRCRRRCRAPRCPPR